ncbi:MAG: thioesterase family protein [Rhodospirillales bacterium]|jgi:acyl-CoA thioester hydrolase|nr:thioesterase family protein [Rhodospirillales bacterium]
MVNGAARDGGMLQSEDDGVWRLHRETVRREWVDYNGHMNVAYYVLIFDHATDAALDRLDIGEAYRERSGCSVFVAEAHVTYEREVHEGREVDIASRVVGFDGKRLILYHEMTAADEDGLVASNEVLCLHVDLGARRSAPLPADAASRLFAVAEAHARLDPPLRSGRAIGLGGRRPG